MSNEIETILDERGSRYGKFTRHAELTQHLKALIFAYKDKDELEYDQVQSLEMICDKIARIINGDPNYADNWVDIAGYATLISKRLEEENYGR